MIKLKNLSFTQRLILAIASGLMVIPLSYLESFNFSDLIDVSITNYSIGLVFALLVMVPFQKSLNWIKTLFMIIASITIYNVVAKLALSHYHLLFIDLDYKTGIILSGALGALLTGFATQLLTPLKLKLSSYGLLFICGAITGYVFSITIDSESIYSNSLGFILWQTTVFLILYFSSNNTRSS